VPTWTPIRYARNGDVSVAYSVVGDGSADVLEGSDHLFLAGDQDAMIDEIEEFLTGRPPVVLRDRILATVLFTDIIRSTDLAAELGDRRWRELLGHYQRLVERELARYRGRLVKWTGDGLLATFDGPARAVRSALAIPGQRPCGRARGTRRPPYRRVRGDGRRHRRNCGASDRAKRHLSNLYVKLRVSGKAARAAAAARFSKSR
jgi:class 3 adenylate cyclase